jgi:hypothetical protein
MTIIKPLITDDTISGALRTHGIDVKKYSGLNNEVPDGFHVRNLVGVFWRHESHLALRLTTTDQNCLPYNLVLDGKTWKRLSSRNTLEKIADNAREILSNSITSEFNQLQRELEKTPSRIRTFFS